MIIYIDMDGVISDFERACELQGLDKKQMNAPDKYLDFSQNPIMFGENMDCNSLPSIEQKSCAHPPQKPFDRRYSNR